MADVAWTRGGWPRTGVWAKSARHAGPGETVLHLLGFAAGGVPPFGHRTRLPLLIDAGILDLRERYGGIVYGGGGGTITPCCA